MGTRCAYLRVAVSSAAALRIRVPAARVDVAGRQPSALSSSLRAGPVDALGGLAGGLIGRRPGLVDPETKTTRTVAVLPLEEVLRDTVPAPASQRLAPWAADLRLKGWSDHSIAVEFGVSDKTIAKAICWFGSRLRSC